MAMLSKEYWEKRYEEGTTSWDVGTITLPLKEYCDQIENKQIRILIPGAGNGYEVDYLFANGFTNIWVIDYASAPLNAIAKRLPQFPKEHLLQINFFDFSPDTKFDLILEQTFFCALDPKLRSLYAERMHKLLNSKGKLAGLLFQFPLTEVGPPFGGSSGEYKALFEPFFTIKKLETAYNSILPRENKELFFIFEKK